MNGQYIPKLLPDNRDAWMVFQEMQDQLRYAAMSNTIVGFNVTAIKHLCDLYEIADWRDTEKKVLKVLRHTIRLRNIRNQGNGGDK